MSALTASFWQSEAVVSIDWQVIYEGPIPRRVNDIAPMSSVCEYVYLFLDSADRLIYVGRSARPADRFTKHRRKAWWADVASTVLLRVNEVPTLERMPWEYSGPNTARLEAHIIDELHPWANIARPAIGATH